MQRVNYLIKNLLATAMLWHSAAIVCAAEPAQKIAPKPAGPPLVRELFIPFDDLNILLDADKNRVFLDRKEYEELLAQAKQKPAEHRGPWSAVLLSSNYDVKVADGRASLIGRFEVEVLNDDVIAVQLPMKGVGLRSATWDTAAAPLGRQPDGQVILFASGKGRHKLVLEFTAAVAESAAQQVLQVQVPQGAVNTLTLLVAGNVELKGGAAVQRRNFDPQNNDTKFELTPPRDSWSLVMSLNNRQKKAERVLVARSVIVDEVTQAYERIHARVAFRVLHGSTETLRLAIPAGFEVTEVASPLLAKWTVTQAPTGRIVELSLREPATETVVVDLTGIKQEVSLAGWKFPVLEPLDVAGHVALATVLLEERLRMGELNPQGALPIDAATLASAIPASVLRVEPGSPSVRQVATYYAPVGKFELQANILKPAIGLRVVTSSLLLLEDKQLSLRGGFALTPEAEDIFSLGFRVPAGWRILEVTDANSSSLPIERFPQADGSTRVLVRFASGLPVGRATSVNYSAVATPADWFQEWNSKEVDFPVITIEGADREQGAIAMHAIDDLLVTPGELTNLNPLLDSEKASYGFGDLPTTLAYYYEKVPYAAKLKAERSAPSLAADIHEFYKVERDRIAVHYEVNYTIRERSTRELAFWLPKSTPEEISITGSNVVIKEYSAMEIGERRFWKVHLAERQVGDVRLVVKFDQPHTLDKDTNFNLPQLEAEGVDYQAVLLAIENVPELNVEALRHPRPVDIGELFGAEYELGRRVVGAYGYTGTSAEVKILVAQQTPYKLPSALVERAELVTIVDPASRGGKAISQSAARFILKTKATLLELELPPQAELWAATLDGTPTKPQKQGTKLLISLPITAAEQIRDLQFVYEAPSSPLGLAGDVRQIAPKLRLPGQGTTEELLLADLVWHLWLPTGYRVTRTNGSVFTDQVRMPDAPAVTALGWLWEMCGGWQMNAAVYRDVAMHKSVFSLGDDGRSFGASSVPQMTGEPLQSLELREETRSMQREGLRGELARPEMDGGKESGKFELPQEPAPGKPMAMPKSESKPAEMPMTKAPADTAPTPQPPPPVTTPDPAAMPKPATDAPMAGEKLEKSIEKLSDQTTSTGKQVQLHLWALEGVRSLRIELQPTGSQVLEFRSLGSQPELRATLVEDRRMSYAAWGAGLVVFLVGVSRCCRPLGERVTYLVSILGSVSLLALLPGIFRDLAPVFDACFFAGCLVALFYLFISFLHSCSGITQKILPACCRLTSRATNPTTATLTLLIIAAISPAVSYAQQDIRIADLIPLLEGGGPVTIPADAIVIPYDPTQEDALAKAEKILVPYDVYVKLWNQANPSKKLPLTKAPADYSLAGFSYEANLVDGDQLQLNGRVTVQVFNEKSVAIPLALHGGVVADAKVDGQPARLQVVDAVAQALAAAKGKPAPVPSPLLLLHVSGRGEKKFEFTIRLPITRQGGRRIVEGKVPAGPATELVLTIPDSGTEVRLPSVPDRQTHETKKPGDKIETALTEAGQLRIEWRPKLAVAMVDQTLTANSTVLLDVREDAVRVAWKLAFEFRGGARDAFELGLPPDYLLEKVAGDNIRGWQVRTENGQSRLDVQLLKAATTNETFTVHLARRGTVGEKEFASFKAPIVEARGAVLHQGELVVRRSPRLELQIGNLQGLNRADIPAALPQLAAATEELDSSVLDLRPYQAYRFATTTFELPLTVRSAVSGATAEIQSLLRMAERTTSLETKFVIRSATPIFRLRAYVPEDFEIAAIEPTELEWSVTKSNGKQLLQVLFLQGQAGKAQVAVRGQLTKRDGNEIAAPVLEVLDVDSQEGELVVQADPDVDIRVSEQKNNDQVFLMQTIGWLRVEQHTLAKTAIRYRSPTYAAKFERVPKKPVVTAHTLTNVKVTRRAVEETSLLYFDVSQAGISELSFLLPAVLEKARIKVPLLRQKTVEEVADKPGWVRVKLQLQDDRIGQLRVLIEHDRLITGEKQSVSLPKIETGDTRQQLLALESAGRDEVVIDGHPGLEPLSRQQPGWREAVSVLGDRINQVYVGEGDSRKSELAFHLQDRARVETSGARIGLAETVLVVDASGAYRAVQQYRVENFTQPYLEVKLPAGAVLWTATVAGEPVKPTPGKTADLVQIPLVKTAEGEADYGVSLKYGGNMPSLSMFGSVKFPLAQTTNVNVELSQVRLLLPESHRWFNFDGTMREVNQGDFAAGVGVYFNRQLDVASKMLTSENPYTQVRARNNLKQLGQAIQNFNWSNAQSPGSNSESLRQIIIANDSLLMDSERQIQTLDAQQQQLAETDNRDRLNKYFGDQSVERAKNAVTKLGSNFSGEAAQSGSGAEFNARWFENNKLQSKDLPTAQAAKEMADLTKSKVNTAGPTNESVNNSQQRFSRAAPQSKAAEAAANQPAKGERQNEELNQAPQVAGGKGKKQLQEQLSNQKGIANQADELDGTKNGKEGEEQRNLSRYQKKLDMQLENSIPQQSLAQNPNFQGQNQQQAFGFGVGGGGLGGANLNPTNGANAPQLQQAEKDRAAQVADPFGDQKIAVDNVQQQLAQEALSVHGVGGLASLDVELPQRGRSYFFTKPRGEVEITARVIPQQTLFKGFGLLGLLVILTLVAGLCRLSVWQKALTLVDNVAGDVLLALVGLIALLIGFLPLLAVLCLLAGFIRGGLRLIGRSVASVA